MVPAPRGSPCGWAFVERHDLGQVFAQDTGFKIERDPDTVRAPDGVRVVWVLDQKRGTRASIARTEQSRPESRTAS